MARIWLSASERISTPGRVLLKRVLRTSFIASSRIAISLRIHPATTLCSSSRMSFPKVSLKPSFALINWRKSSVSLSRKDACLKRLLFWKVFMGFKACNGLDELSLARCVNLAGPKQRDNENPHHIEIPPKRLTCEFIAEIAATRSFAIAGAVS